MRNILVGAAVAAVMSSCGGGTSDPANGMQGAFVPNASNPRATCDTPRGPWGFSPGHLQQPWTIQTCDGAEYDLYNDDFCTAKATVVMLSQGWCPECTAAAEHLREDIIEPYSAQGIRFLEILQQDASYEVISSEFCHQWEAEYDIAGFTFMDPDRTISTYSYRPGVDETPAGSTTEALPVVNIYDATGAKRFHIEGGSNEQAIEDALEELLAE